MKKLTAISLATLFSLTTVAGQPAFAQSIEASAQAEANANSNVSLSSDSATADANAGANADAGANANADTSDAQNNAASEGDETVQESEGSGARRY